MRDYRFAVSHYFASSGLIELDDPIICVLCIAIACSLS